MDKGDIRKAKETKQNQDTRSRGSWLQKLPYFNKQTSDASNEPQDLSHNQAHIELLSGVTKWKASYVIDASKFKPEEIQNLSKLDLSMGIERFIYDISHIKMTGLKPLDQPVRDGMPELMKKLSDALRDGYNYKTYIENPGLYKKVLIAYHTFRVRSEIDKIADTNPSNDQSLITASGGHGNLQVATTDSLAISLDDLASANENLQQLQKQISAYKPTEGKPPAGVTERGEDSYEIDILVLNPPRILGLSKHDLARLDLSRGTGLKGFTYDLSRLDLAKFNKDIDPALDKTMNELMEKANYALKDGYKYEAYKYEHDTYKLVLMYYHAFRVTKDTGKTKDNDLHLQVATAQFYLQELINYNQEFPAGATEYEFTTGENKKGKSYIIDASTFNLAEMKSLSKLDLSEGMNRCKYENINIPESSRDLSLDELNRIQLFTNFASGTLKTAYLYGIYREHDALYRRVLTDYHRLRIMRDSKKTHLDSEHSNVYVSLCKEYRVYLKDINVDTVKNAKPKKSKKQEISSDQITTNTENTHLETHSTCPGLKFLFSKNETERHIAEQISITLAYYDLLNRKGVDTSKEHDFDTVNFLSKEIINGNITDIPPENHQAHLQHIRDVNQNLRAIAERLAATMLRHSSKNNTNEQIEQKDLNPFQLALRDEIVATTSYHSWTENWTTIYPHRFRFDEPWLQGSMGRLGLKKEDVYQSYEKFLSDGNFLDALYPGSINNRVYIYSTKDALRHYEALVRTNTDLKYIHSQIGKGFPVDAIPEIINGRRQKSIDIDQNNCLIHAWIKSSNTNLDDKTIKDKSREIRVKFIEKMSKRLKNLENQIIPDAEEQATNYEALSLLYRERDRLKERIPQIEEGGMLEQGYFEGRLLIECLIEEGVPIDRSRGLLIYRCYKGRIICTESEIMPRSPEAAENAPPYVFFSEHDFHFNAMVEDMGTVINDMNALSDQIKMYRENHKDDLEKVLTEKGMTWKDYKNLRYIAKTLSQLESGTREDVIIETSKQAIKFLKSIDEAMSAHLQV
ncbi:MAG TPA: hypothetical protein VK553_08185 [Candidatus Nitrosopolaris rasttigaisensis]|nr:hypothetical protein [Candidatus Nitrosopolaris rasttigaisensis]